MKKLTKTFQHSVVLLLLILLLAACTGDMEEESETNLPSGDNTALESEGETEETEESNPADGAEEAQEATTDDSSETSSEETGNDGSNNTSNNEEDNILSEYTSEEIEYARVWLQLGPNQEIDELNVRHIPAGTPINPDDDTSANYPEDVIQLAGSRLVDGSVTYSGNGDGTINVYNVPLRWDGEYPAGEEFYIDMIENTKLEYVDLGDDEKIIELIEVLIGQ